jgi:hypothetical protein
VFVCLVKFNFLLLPTTRADKSHVFLLFLIPSTLLQCKQENLPAAEPGMKTLARNAVSGFCASVVSDTTSNSIRVMKTTKQTSEVALTYLQTFKIVVEKDGLIGLFGRGLKTRILTNGLQGMMFSVLWKEMEKRMNAGKD